MKKLFSILLLVLSVTLIGNAQNNVKLEVGMKAPAWVFQDADKKNFTMDSWKGKVLQINYVDPDESDLNDPFNDAIDKAVDIDKRIDRDHFKGFGIVDVKSSWKPTGLIRWIAGKKAKKYDTTILFDYDGKLQQKWGLPSDSYSIIIVDKNRVCRAIYRGKVPDSKIDEVIDLIIKITKE